MEVGKTKSVGYQVGVRRTFPIRLEDAWQMVMSRSGMEIWLGELSSYDLNVGNKYITSSGISGEIRVVNENQNIRLTWKKEHWERASTLQIRTIEQKNDKCTISFHQENLSSLMDREEMKTRWEEVLGKLKNIV
ncbi:SRPBCC domain-containing protein [Paenibacillus sp. KQZ6P-2]|uniref:SRPBCC domain-containing protein n=1 Tax=Paenibacillus mangrovi TaxID=2931978 RepID=A0A9X1WTB8_9BACL|nr:SRPBCC domain-containing protein [Paenibacillus mangrovi]MCJ8013205.1 SRPBCC domain-containing protein [Paenibacillus mangrovi]